MQRRYGFTVFILLIYHASVFAVEPLRLSLADAILFAVRENPNVQQAQLTALQQKHNLEIQQWQFQPHYSISASDYYTKTNFAGLQQTTNGFNLQPTISWNSPIGTNVTLGANNTWSAGYIPSLSLQVMQPLLRGFGKPIVEAALYDAMDSVTISQLGIESALRTTVTSVIAAYLTEVSAERTVTIDKDALTRAEQSLQQTKLFIQAGHKAGNELVTVSANVATSQTQLENDKNNLHQAQYALLTAIGIDPNTPVIITNLNLDKLIQAYHLPAEENIKSIVLDHDIQYQVDQITLHGQTTRGLMIAKDNTRWQLNFTANASTTTNDSVNNVFSNSNSGINQTQSAMLNLQIPIDDRLAKQAVENAEIGLQEAELALKQEKWGKETNAINAFNTVVSALRALTFAKEAENLQQKTYQISYQKYLHGLIDGLELQSAQLQFITAQQASLSARIGYLNALVNLDLLMGNTLKTWNVKVRLQ